VSADLTRPTRVARVIARLNVGGAARHVVWLTAGLNGGRFENALVIGVVPPGEDDMSAFAAEQGVEPIVVPAMSREISPSSDAVTLWRLFRFFRRFRPDIVHTHTAKAGAAGRAAAFLYRWLSFPRPRRVKLVHTYHGHVFHSYYGRFKTRFFVLVERMLARITDRIIVLSEQQRREIHEVYGVGRREQFRVVPLGIDLDDLQPRLPVAGEPLTVGIVGRLAPIKNHELFLRTAALLRDVPRVRFAIYGNGGERPELEARAAALNVSDRVAFAGTRPAREIYSSIDIAALTSLNEGTPLTLIEAMAHAVPVISTSVGGVVDVLGEVRERVTADGATFEIRERGITTASNDDAAFAAGLRRLLADRELRRELGARGRAYAHATYSKDRLIGDIIRVYDELRAG
jgi:glycosyltransferase involved in cell wall biosynthesis